MDEERRLAENVCKVHAQGIIDDCNGITLSGHEIAEKHFEKWKNPTVYNALCHWLLCAGYSESGKFEYILSNHIQ